MQDTNNDDTRTEFTPPSTGIGTFILTILFTAFFTVLVITSHVVTTYCRFVDSQQFCVSDDRVYKIVELGTPEDRALTQE